MRRLSAPPPIPAIPRWSLRGSVAVRARHDPGGAAPVLVRPGRGLQRCSPGATDLGGRRACPERQASSCVPSFIVCAAEHAPVRPVSRRTRPSLTTIIRASTRTPAKTILLIMVTTPSRRAGFSLRPPISADRRGGLSTRLTPSGAATLRLRHVLRASRGSGRAERAGTPPAPRRGRRRRRGSRL